VIPLLNQDDLGTVARRCDGRHETRRPAAGYQNIRLNLSAFFSCSQAHRFSYNNHSLG
jgi:hypothetical protein